MDFKILIILLLVLSISTVISLRCNIFDPTCRERLNQQPKLSICPSIYPSPNLSLYPCNYLSLYPSTSFRLPVRPDYRITKKCDYSKQRFWLIPRMADNTTCS